MRLNPVDLLSEVVSGQMDLISASDGGFAFCTSGHDFRGPTSAVSQRLVECVV